MPTPGMAGTETLEVDVLVIDVAVLVTLGAVAL